MDQCPPEILQIILANLPDFGSLQSTILVSRRTRTVFQGRQSWIVREVLSREIPRALWFDAEAAFKASQIALHCEMEPRKDFIEWYLDRDVESFHASFQPDLRHCLVLREFYKTVQNACETYLARGLVSYASHGDYLAEPQVAVPISDTEKTQIEGCFFRFEVFSRIFCMLKDNPTDAGITLMIKCLNEFAP